MKSFFNKVMTPFLGLAFGLFICALLSIFFKENPLKILKVITLSFYSSPYELGLTLYYTTCFIFSGLAFSIPFRTGLFNIGAEGHLLFSGFAAGITGVLLTDQSRLTVVLIGLLSAIFWSLFIGLFKILRQAHEVVVAIMLNYILSALTTYWTVQYFQNPHSQNPETALWPDALQLTQVDPFKKIFDGSPASSLFVVALVVAILVHVFENKTSWGLKLKAYGINSAASNRLGFSEVKIITGAFIFAGAMAGMVGLTEVLGSSSQFKVGFSPQLGFIGIAVSILARQNAIGIIFSAFLFAVLHKGASDLDLESDILTRDFSKVVQAIIIFSVASFYFLAPRLKFFRNKDHSP